VGKRLKHPESQYWTACFRDQNGRQRRISTKETNNKKALKIAEEFERAARTSEQLNRSKYSAPDPGSAPGRRNRLDPLIWVVPATG